MRRAVIEFARGAAIELFHLLTFNGCARWVWAYEVCHALETWYEDTEETWC